MKKRQNKKVEKVGKTKHKNNAKRNKYETLKQETEIIN